MVTRYLLVKAFLDEIATTFTLMILIILMFGVIAVIHKFNMNT